MKLIRILTAGAALAALSLNLQADVTLVVTGGNASKSVLFDRAAFILSGETVVNNAGNSNLRSLVNGTIPSQPGLGNITIHFILNGATLGIADLRDQNNLTTAGGATVKAQLAVSSTAPETVGINPSIFHQDRTLVVPFVYVKNDTLPNTIHGVTNLTQRQAAYLEAASGTLPTAYFGGESTLDPLYLIGRDTGAAVRQIIDASIYFSGTPAFWTTNVAPNPALPPIPFGGHIGGAGVVADLGIIPNAIGTVSVQDIGTLTPLSYEGVPFSTANVAKGFYPIWGYERWLYKTSGAGQPTAQQLAVINALLAAVTDNTFQHTSSTVVGKFVPLGDLEVERTVDGGPISSILY